MKKFEKVAELGLFVACLLALWSICYFSSKQEIAYVTYVGREYRVIVDRKNQTLEMECYPCVSGTIVKQKNGKFRQVTVVAHRGPAWPIGSDADQEQIALWNSYFGKP